MGAIRYSLNAENLSMMHDKDLTWSFVVNNYLMGREPISFNTFYWSTDFSRMLVMISKSYLLNLNLVNKLDKLDNMDFILKLFYFIEDAVKNYSSCLIVS